jgi:hypothetical protein
VKEEEKKEILPKKRTAKTVEKVEVKSKRIARSVPKKG